MEELVPKASPNSSQGKDLLTCYGLTLFTKVGGFLIPLLLGIPLSHY